MVVHKKSLENKDTPHLPLTENTVNVLQKALVAQPSINSSLGNHCIGNILGNHHSKFLPTVPKPVNIDPKIRKIRESLPVFKYRREILEAIETHNIVVISGETGIHDKLISMNIIKLLIGSTE